MNDRRLKGSSLVFALLLILLISLLMGSLLLFQSYRYKTVSSFINNSRLIDNSYSGMRWLITHPLQNETYHWNGDLYGASSDSVHLSASYHGIFRLNECRSQNQNKAFFTHSFSGIHLQNVPHLQLANSRQVLSIGGLTQIDVESKIPEGRIELAMIKDHFYSGSKRSTQTIQSSEENIPSLEEKSYYRIQDLLNHTHVNTISNLNSLDSLNVPFLDQTAFFSNRNRLILTGKKISGKVCITSSDEIVISQDNHLEHVVLAAPKITIKRGFEGAVQLIASDTILIEEDVKLSYPSAVICLSNDQNTGSIAVGRRFDLEGILAIVSRPGTNAAGTIAILEGMRLEGMIYNPGQTMLHDAEIYGYLFSTTIDYKNKSGVHRNTLIDVKLMPHRSEKAICGLSFNALTSKHCIGTWL